jgi:hypothetical protein
MRSVGRRIVQRRVVVEWRAVWVVAVTVHGVVVGVSELDDRVPSLSVRYV